MKNLELLQISWELWEYPAFYLPLVDVLQADSKNNSQPLTLFYNSQINNFLL